MNCLEQAIEYIEQNKESLVEDLRKLIAIPSVTGTREGDYPFGKNVNDAFEFMLTKGEKEGFITYNCDNYGGHIDFPGTGNETMGIVGHLDVVPEGSGWKHGPFDGEIEDGKLFGRGTIDDKGPMMAAFYAMEALKESGFQPEKTVRMILGLDEETEWAGMDYYLSKTPSPDFGITPDGDFPAIQGEKGIIVFDIAGKFAKSQGSGLKLRTLKGGNAANMVADSARAVVLADDKAEYERIKDTAAWLRDEKNYRISCRQVGKSFEIVTTGISAHGASPWHGFNAISVMMDVLGRLNFENDDVNSFIDFYNSCIGFELDGTSLGCGFEDEPSGKLILNVGKINLQKDAVELTVNVRYPVTDNSDHVYEGMSAALEKYNLGVIKGHEQLPIYLPDDDAMITTLMDVYRRYTGDMETAPMVIGGGTYARAFKNVVAFGPAFPGDPEVMHQKDEFIEIDKLINTAKIYTETIYRLCGAEE